MRELACWLLFRRRRRYGVAGNSMTPTLHDGDQVLVDPRRAPRPGDVVVARHTLHQSVVTIKRLTGFDERGRAILHGDNPAESTDSRTLGNTPRELLFGVVTSILVTGRPPP